VTALTGKAMATRTIRIFLSTPSDVEEERRALAAVVAETNDVIAFLAPEREVRLELIHYKTHAYPDVGGTAQAVVDHQIPGDYDIHFGIMWKRCGTPTNGRQSGTIYEFERAFDRREQEGRPIIMFYFGMESVAMPTAADEIEQLANVVRFRERLMTLGLTQSYPTRAEFREHARIGLLRAVADLVRRGVPERHATPEADREPEIPRELRDLCDEYVRVRREMKPGPSRTQRMADIFEKMKTHAPSIQPALEMLKRDESAGRRLAAVAILQVFPRKAALKWLADRLDPEAEAPFVGYHAAQALLQAVRSLPSNDRQQLQTQLHRALELAQRNSNDPPRIRTLERALVELDQLRRRTGS
jgi:hypothetical protein